MIKAWRKISSKLLGDFRIFTLRSDRKVSPRNGTEHEVFVIDAVDWVNVVAVTPDNHLVMVEQYRHGTNTVELEIPDRKSTRLNSSHITISYAVFCLKK